MASGSDGGGTGVVKNKCDRRAISAAARGERGRGTAAAGGAKSNHSTDEQKNSEINP
jgi:hypothetical protein